MDPGICNLYVGREHEPFWVSQNIGSGDNSSACNGSTLIARELIDIYVAFQPWIHRILSEESIVILNPSIQTRTLLLYILINQHNFRFIGFQTTKN